jgi:hypothetical protein
MEQDEYYEHILSIIDSFIFLLLSLEYRASVKRLISLQFIIFRQSVGLLGRRISPSQGRYLHRTTQTQNKRRQTSMLRVGFERAKTFHALPRAAIVTGHFVYTCTQMTITCLEVLNYILLRNHVKYVKLV